jgi:hypothetical protein
MSGVAVADGHNASRLIAPTVPDFAAEGDDLVVGFEDEDRQQVTIITVMVMV